jgi:glycosyltransferase involved in cell wall biosynthesis
VRHEETGLLVPYGDVSALASALAALAADPARVARLGAQARPFAEGYSWDAAADRVEAHLESVAAGRGLAEDRGGG